VLSFSKGGGANPSPRFVARGDHAMPLGHTVAVCQDESLVLGYHSVINLADGKVRGAEAVVGWQHPLRGLIPASESIRTVEPRELFGSPGPWLLHTACRDAAAWTDLTGASFVAVNLFPSQFPDARLIHQVAAALAASGLAPSRLYVEITETMLKTSLESAAASLKGLKRLGVRTVVTDFGSAASSLAYLTQLPIDYLKLNPMFLAGLDESSDNSETSAMAVFTLADLLGIRIIADGVETERQANALRELGCDLAQGPRYCRPRPADTSEHPEETDRLPRRGAAPAA